MVAADADLNQLVTVLAEGAWGVLLTLNFSLLGFFLEKASVGPQGGNFHPTAPHSAS